MSDSDNTLSSYLHTLRATSSGGDDLGSLSAGARARNRHRRRCLLDGDSDDVVNRPREKYTDGVGQRMMGRHGSRRRRRYLNTLMSDNEFYTDTDGSDSDGTQPRFEWQGHFVGVGYDFFTRRQEDGVIAGDAGTGAVANGGVGGDARRSNEAVARAARRRNMRQLRKMRQLNKAQNVSKSTGTKKTATSEDVGAANDDDDDDKDSQHVINNINKKRGQRQKSKRNGMRRRQRVVDGITTDQEQVQTSQSSQPQQQQESDATSTPTIAASVAEWVVVPTSIGHSDNAKQHSTDAIVSSQDVTLVVDDEWVDASEFESVVDDDTQIDRTVAAVTSASPPQLLSNSENSSDDDALLCSVDNTSSGNSDDDDDTIAVAVASVMTIDQRVSLVYNRIDRPARTLLRRVGSGDVVQDFLRRLERVVLLFKEYHRVHLQYDNDKKRNIDTISPSPSTATATITSPHSAYTMLPLSHLNSANHLAMHNFRIVDYGLFSSNSEDDDDDKHSRPLVVHACDAFYRLLAHGVFQFHGLCAQSRTEIESSGDEHGRRRLTYVTCRPRHLRHIASSAVAAIITTPPSTTSATITSASVTTATTTAVAAGTFTTTDINSNTTTSPFTVVDLLHDPAHSHTFSLCDHLDNLSKQQRAQHALFRRQQRRQQQRISAEYVEKQRRAKARQERQLQHKMQRQHVRLAEQQQRRLDWSPL